LGSWLEIAAQVSFGKHGRKRRRRGSFCLEALEERTVPTSRAFSLNDPDFLVKQWGV